MLILVNVFAIASAVLFYFKKVQPLAFLISSMLWFVLMLVFWYLLPQLIYRKERTFKDSFRAGFSNSDFFIENSSGTQRSWPWSSFSTWMESPHFLHLYFNSRSFFIVPKEAFEDDQLMDVRKILQEKIKRESL